MEEKINTVKKEYIKKISQAKSLKDLDKIFLEIFGKNGVVTLLPKEFPKLSKEDLKVIGPLFNKTKQELEEAVSDKRQEIREEIYKSLDNEKLVLEDVEVKERKGHLNPITQFENKIADIFKKIGFQQFEGPDIDSDYYNFEVLNIPKQHPARDLWDTLYIDSKRYGINPGELLMRTHTSNNQVRIMEKYKPPFRFMVIGRSYRYENVGARYDHTFDQFELVYVDKVLSIANLQYLSEYFLKAMFGEDMKARLRPKYYPFVEPGAGIDGLCIFCKGKGCKVCNGTGWLELAGAGMIHPQVLENGGIDSKVYSGIAWGVGPARMAMLKYGINDLRLFNSGELEFLEKY